MPEQQNNENNFDDLQERFAPGETSASDSSQVLEGEYGDRKELIPEEYQTELRRMVESIQTRDLYARITEVRRAGKGNFYLRNIFDAYWSEQQDTWVVGGDNPGQGNSELNYPLNIYGAYERSFVKLVGHKPKVHFTANGPTSKALLVADAADTLLCDIEHANDMKALAQDFARISWTDGRYGIYTRWVADSNLWGFYDDLPEDGEAEGLGGADTPPKKTPRLPRGNVRYDIYGVPWLKMPVNAKRLSEAPWLSLGDEIDVNIAKSTWPRIAEKIQSGQPGPGEFMFERTTRIAIIQGIHLVSQMAEAEIDMPTMQIVWLRTSEFASITDKKKRQWFWDNYPDGCKVVFVGNQYAESANESMDKHWSLGWAVRAPGMQGIPYGYSMLNTQDMYNDVIDLEMETHMRAIPAMYVDPAVFDLGAYSKEKAMPGMRFPLKHDLDPNINIQQKVFTEPQVSVSQQLINLRDSIPTSISNFVTGISRGAQGQSDEDNTTLGGIAMLNAASRGETGTVWVGFVEAYTRSAEQAVRIAAQYRMAETDEGILRIGRRGKPDAKIDLVELRMSEFWCIADSDQTYPSTHEEEEMRLNALTTAAQMGDAQAKSMLEDPANAERFAQLRGISGAKSSTGIVGAKVYQLIEDLLLEEPQPNMQAIMQAKMAMAQAAQQGAPPPQPNPYQLLTASRQPGPLDNAALELPFFIEWVYSPIGLRSKELHPRGFVNVELYAMKLQQAVQQQQQQQMMQQVAPHLLIEKAKKVPQGRHPSEAINFKDLGPSGRLQIAAQAGIDIQADVAEEMTENQINPPAPEPRRLRR